MSIEKMRDLITRLNAASRAYYQENREILSDYEYDALYDSLLALEAQMGIQLAISPTNKVGYEVVGALQKAPHDVPMLSLNKTKDVDALVEFIEDKQGLILWKLDGLSIILRYENGVLKQALTRGNGQIGEDVTHNARVFANIPLMVPYQGRFSVKGEAVITFTDFETINENEKTIEKYKNPRNLCSGTVRQLNSEVASTRRVFFYAFGMVDDGINIDLKSAQLEWLSGLGFEVVEHDLVTAKTIPDIVTKYKSRVYDLPVATDGLVLTYDDIEYSLSLGATSKFPRDSLAFKWADDISETVLTTVEWNPSRTGLINPVAIFEPVEIEGSIVSRASLHNVSVLRTLELGEGDKITVFKANMIIPQVAENLTRSNTITIPEICPTCENDTEIVIPLDSEVLVCINPACPAKQIQSLVHFVGRDGINIEGLSEQTLEKFIEKDLIKNFSDIFNIANHKQAIISMEGFGLRSYNKIITAIEKAKDISLPNFIYALGIRHVGLANAKLLCSHFAHDYEKIINVCRDENYQEILSEIKGFGDAIIQSLHSYFTNQHNFNVAQETINYLNIKTVGDTTKALPLLDLVFVITGDVRGYPNRKALQAYIESLGGKVTSTVTAKTSYLINNDATSSSSKNKKAIQLGVAIISEKEFENIANEISHQRSDIMVKTDWFTNARFGMFIHWGIYAIPARGEWVRSVENISVEDYQPYFDNFDPVDYDPIAWAKAAKQAGMKYAILTAKHHDGFCLFDSKLTDYKATNTKAGRDLIKEYVDAFRAEGIKIGLYYSVIDWHHPDYPHFGDRHHPMRDNESYKEHNHNFDNYLKYMHGQVEELCTNYGQIDVFWFDFSYDDMSGEKWEATELLRMIRKYWPDVLINNRLEGEGMGYGSLNNDVPNEYAGDFMSPEKMIPPDGIRNKSGQPLLWESCVTMNNNWGYSATDYNYKPAEMMIKKLVECVSKGGNLLLNVGPDAKGNIPKESLDILEKIGNWMKENSESIYNCGFADLPKPEYGRITRKGNILYYHITENQVGGVPLTGIKPDQIKRMWYVATGAEIKLSTEWYLKALGDIPFVSFGDSHILPDLVDTVVGVELKFV